MGYLWGMLLKELEEVILGYITMHTGIYAYRMGICIETSINAWSIIYISMDIFPYTKMYIHVYRSDLEGNYILFTS